MVGMVNTYPPLSSHPRSISFLLHFRIFFLTKEIGQELEADINRQRLVLSNARMIEARDKAEVEEMNRIRQQSALTAIEDAANMRTERIQTGEPAAPDRA